MANGDARRERVIAMTVAIIRDPSTGKILVLFHERGAYILPGGKIKRFYHKNPRRDRPEDDLVEICTGPTTKARWITQTIMQASRRESGAYAARRESWQELFLEPEPPIVRRQHFTAVKATHVYPFIEIHNRRGDGTGYNKDIETTALVIAAEVTIPLSTIQQIHHARRMGDLRAIFVSLEEIASSETVDGLRLSPDNARILRKIGVLENYSSEE